MLCKNSQTDRDAVWDADSNESKEPRIIDGGKDRTNPFAAAKGDKSAMWPFAK